MTEEMLANDNRLRILHASQQAVSNQLQRLADRRIVHSRRDGNRVLYHIIDPCVPGLMDLGVCRLSERTRP